jgi:hypothetical protein
MMVSDWMYGKSQSANFWRSGPSAYRRMCNPPLFPAAWPVRLGEKSSHKYSVTLRAYGQNIFNHENLSPLNGTLSSPLLGKSQSLAGGFFGASTAGNRSIFFEADFHF